MKVKIKKLVSEAITPTYATDGSGCFDIYSLDNVVLRERYQHEFKTGLSFEVPEGYIMLIFSRSGHGFTHGIRLSNCVGVIDSDYRGEVAVKLQSDTTLPHGALNIIRGDRIAQALILPIPKIEFEEVSNLTETQRGANGFGSTGS